MDRSKPGAGVVKKMARLVSEHHSLIVFPEGTRSLDGTVARFKAGSFVLAVESQLPIVPVSIVGSRHVMTKGRLMVRPGDVTITVHAPIETASVPRDAVRALPSRCGTLCALRSSPRRMCDPALQFAWRTASDASLPPRSHSRRTPKPQPFRTTVLIVPASIMKTATCA